ncbi:MAG TPA: DegT/DnrJ/EryC1/StrS family aminotransferase [Bacteroidales bacterium]|nr:DegT/DnrJ/EryC1/StrS family aminotransferase [Bacteroidales bacterium]HOR81113.1 DegT/DnrJ/EryC1/StrS family aminotransferase [Bacteroidales bacterium]HPJ90765.1 DegT/DnrJ/EryC1/StrS family aminotransferase [Bacteroidales bacterium]
MRKIQMVDLQKQYQDIKEEVDSAIQEVINNCTFINGPSVKQFQANLEKYLHVKHVIPCGNGTDGLQVSLMALDLQPGDEVITTTFTFIATAEVIALLKLTPVLVDVDPYTFNISISAVEKAVTNKTKAIIPVHLFGQCVDMESLMKIAEKHNLHIIEDACQAIGADYHFSNGEVKKAGTMGIIGCTSFFPSKNLGCYGDGGAVFTNDDVLAKKLRGIVNHGMFVRYYHDIVGVNSRLDSIQAAILDVKLKRLDDYIKRRNAAASFYNQVFANHENIVIPQRHKKSTHVFHQYTLVLKNVDRDKVVAYMKEQEIPVMIYYPVPLHLQKAYEYLSYKKGDLPVSEALSESVISLPMHTELDDEQLNYITSHLLKAISLSKK